MEDVCKYFQVGFCKFKEQCEKNHVKEQCENGNTCSEKETCRLRHQKRCNTNEDIKKIKAKLDVLKNTVKTLVSIKTEGQKVKMDVKHVKEEKRLLIDNNKETAEKISQIEDDCLYDTEEEEFETHKRNVQTNVRTLNKEEIKSCLAKNVFEDFEDLFQIESVEGEAIFACNVCDEGFGTEVDVKRHINKYHVETLHNISKESNAILQDISQEKKVHYDTKSVAENLK